MVSHRVGEHVVLPELRPDESDEHQHGEGKDIAVRPGLDRAAKVFHRHVPGSPRSRRRQGSDVYSMKYRWCTHKVCARHFEAGSRGGAGAYTRMAVGGRGSGIGIGGRVFYHRRAYTITPPLCMVETFRTGIGVGGHAFFFACRCCLSCVSCTFLFYCL